MKLSVLLFCGIAGFALTGCSTGNSLFAARDAQPAPIDLANTSVPAASPIPSNFCQHVSLHARQEALSAGFDSATQERMALQNASQCASFTDPRGGAL